MLRFARWLNYRDEALGHLGALLAMYPRGRQFTRDFPGLRRALKAHFDAGLSPAGAALQLGATIIADLARQLDAGGRAAAAAELKRISADELGELAARQISRQPDEVPPPAIFLARLAGVALFLGGRMAEEGRLAQGEMQFFAATVDNALRTGGDAGNSDVPPSQPSG